MKTKKIPDVAASARPCLFLVDGHALCYRAFFAIRDLTTSTGQATNAVFGFVNTLRKILRAYEPQYMAVCFDSHAKTHRQEKFAAYKIQRPKMPDELISQIPIIKQVVEAYNIPIFEMGGFEADDIIATLCHQGLQEDIDIVIVSEDKDLYQLADKRVRFFSARKDALLSEKDLFEKWGFDLARIADFIALAGDSSDNIPGVKGIGEVTARALITQFGTLDAIYAHLDELAPKLREKLVVDKAAAQLSKELALLDMNVPFQLDMAQLKVEEPNTQRLVTLFKELEFKKFADEVVGNDTRHLAAAVAPVVVASDIAGLIEKVREKKQCTFLIEKAGDEETAVALGMVVCVDPQQVYTVDAHTVSSLKDIFEDRAITKITHDIKSAKVFLNGFSIVLSEGVFDVMLAGYLLGSSASGFAVEDLAWNFLKRHAAAEDTAAYKVQVLMQLYPLVRERLRVEGLDDLFWQVEVPLAYVLADMECHGVGLDTDVLIELAKECDGKIDSLTTELYKIAGGEFNLNSPKQLSVVLFEKLKLPAFKKTKTGYSTNEEVLSRLALKHEFPAMILEYRQLAKLKSTYIDALPKLVDAKGRIHTEFLQTGTETGRLSSRHPNLQNIPVRTPLGQQIRRAIVPTQKELILISADYSQIELRILAHLSGDEQLTAAFKKGEDIHQFTASLIFDVALDAVTKEMRTAAKRVNFGIVYGISAFGLANDLKVSAKEAQDFIDRYFLRYPLVKEFMDQTIVECEEKGYVSTLLKRRRYIPEIKSPNQALRQFAQRQAINTPVQGSAADLIKIAMVRVQQRLQKETRAATVLMTVHDELVLEAPANEVDAVITVLRECMETPLALSVPIVVNMKTGKNWLEMKDYGGSK